MQTLAVSGDARVMVAAPLPAAGGDGGGAWALMRGSIFREENILQLPEVSSQLFSDEIPPPPYPSTNDEGGAVGGSGGGGGGLFGGLISKLKDGLGREDDAQGACFVSPLCLHLSPQPPEKETS